MTLGDLFDLILCLTIVTVALAAIVGKDLFASVALYVAYGLLLAIAWVRLGALDVALAEAAIGAGLTGVLLLSAVARAGGPQPPERIWQAVPLLLCAALAVGLALALLDLIGHDAGLQTEVTSRLAQSGVDNPVTAVLLNFRAWDTLLESVILLIALVGVWALGPEGSWGGRPGLRQQVSPLGVMATFGRFLPPFGIVIGAYLMWIGTSAPGGAFQAATVLAAIWLLTQLSGLVAPPSTSSHGLRWGLILGPALFLAAGLYGIVHGAFLAFPSGSAGGLILAIEFALTLSIALTLALLVLGPARQPR